MIKKVTFGVKYYFFRKRDDFPLKVVNFRKTLKKGSFMQFWREKKCYRKIKIKA